MMIEFNQVSMSYTQRERIDVLKAVDFKITAGEWVSIVGPSGCGKTTFLNLAGCLLKPASGRVSIEGIDTGDLKDDELAEIRNRKIGFIFQGSYLLPPLTLLENVLVPTFFSRPPKDNRADLTARARKLLAQFGLADRLDSLPHELSQGQKRRVAIARALINEPRIILADEPTNDLDPERARQIAAELSGLNRQGLTLLTVSHNPELSMLAGRQYRIDDGKLRAILD